jgi:hypothetical protein
VLYPIRSVYIAFLKSLLENHNSEISRVLIKRFEMPDKLDQQEKKRQAALKKVIAAYD